MCSEINISLYSVVACAQPNVIAVFHMCCDMPFALTQRILIEHITSHLRRSIYLVLQCAYDPVFRTKWTRVYSFCLVCQSFVYLNKTYALIYLPRHLVLMNIYGPTFSQWKLITSWVRILGSIGSFGTTFIFTII